MRLKQKPSHCLNHHSIRYPFLSFTSPALLTFSMWEIPSRVVLDAKSRDWGKNVGKKAFRTLDSQMFWVLEQHSRTVGALWTDLSGTHGGLCARQRTDSGARLPQAFSSMQLSTQPSEPSSVSRCIAFTVCNDLKWVREKKREMTSVFL